MAFISVILSLLIVAVVILAALMLYRGSPTPGTDSVTSPIERGEAVQCLAQVRRVELAIRMHQTNKGTYPASLDELKALSSNDFYCPVTSSSFNYNSRTGKVTCPDHP
jgi:hypothetical protein